jgi:dUTP pyrophosphatase
MTYTLFIKFVKHTPHHVKEYYEEFTTHHEGDAGIDLYTPFHITFNECYVETIDFMIQCEMKDEMGNNVSYYLYPRSSISKTPIMLANSVGIIDAGYRGNIMAKVRNVEWRPDMPNNYAIKVSEKLFQICSPDLKPIKLQIVSEISETSRGTGGFGSTGK